MIRAALIAALLAAPAAAAACEGFAPNASAVPRLGPLPTEDGAALEVAPDEVLAVMDAGGATVTICRDGAVAALRRSHLIEVPDAGHVVAGPSFGAEGRARVVFWDGLAPASAFLAGSLEDWAAPVLRELPGGKAGFRWPVFAAAGVAILDGRRDADLRAVLVPVALDAAALYAERLGDGSGQAGAVVVLDISARSGDWLGRTLGALAELLAADANFRDLPVSVVTFGRGAAPALLAETTPAGLARLRWSLRAPADGETKSLTPALDLAREAGGGAPVIVLAAGDVDEGEAPEGDPVHFVQVTPELDRGLSRVARTPDRFTDFADNLHAAVYELFVRHVAPRRRRAPGPEDLADYIGAMAAAGFMPLAPADLRALHRLLPEAVLPEGTRWVARPVWVAVDGEVLAAEPR